MTKQCLVEVFVRDAGGNIVDIQSAPGTTEDDGVHVTIPLGYAPMLSSAEPANIKVTVYHPATEITPVGLVSRTENYADGVQAIEFNLAP